MAEDLDRAWSLVALAEVEDLGWALSWLVVDVMLHLSLEVAVEGSLCVFSSEMVNVNEIERELSCKVRKLRILNDIRNSANHNLPLKVR